jgi:2-polyprenyl-6-methoxyphenol hydroxylase-like FAD-dependent oxidoreductase
VLEEALTVSEPIGALRARNQRHHFFMDLPLEGDRRTFGVRRGSIFQALQRRVATSGIDLRCGLRVERLGFADDRVELECQHGERHGPFDFVVVADGSRSSLRAALKLSTFGRDYSAGAMWFCGRSPFPHQHLHQVSQGSLRLTGLLPTGGGQCSLFWSCSRSEWDRYRSRPLPKWKREVLGLAPEMGTILEQITSWEQPLFATYRHHWLPRWWSHRAVLIGDAAHSMSPHLGQGTNLGLLDAHSLAKSLRLCSDFATACRRYQAKRQRQVAFYSALSFALSPFFQSRPDLVQSFGRDLALPLMVRIPYLRRQMQCAIWGQKPSALTDWVDLEELT